MMSDYNIRLLTSGEFLKAKLLFILQEYIQDVVLAIHIRKRMH